MTALHRRLRKWFERAVLDYQMLERGDRVLVAVSGSTDSLSLLTLLSGPKIAVTEDISLVAVHLDLGFEKSGEEDWNQLEQHFHEMGCEYIIERTQIGVLRPVGGDPGHRFQRHRQFGHQQNSEGERVTGTITCNVITFEP